MIIPRWSASLAGTAAGGRLWGGLRLCLWSRRGRLIRRGGAFVAWATVGIAVVFGERVVGLEPVAAVEAEEARRGAASFRWPLLLKGAEVCELVCK